MVANSSNTNVETPVYLGAGEVDVEKGYGGGRPGHIERMVTPGGHPVDFSQPAIPVQHRKYGNPIPVGLLAFAFGFLMVGLFTVGARGITNPTVVIPSLMLFMGITQTLVGWFEMFIGNTYSATLFVAYGGFDWGYGAIFLPQMGVMDAYKDPETGALDPQFNQAVGIFFVCWTVVTFFFLMASFRSSVAVFTTLFWAMMSFLTLGIAEMAPSKSMKMASGAVCLIASAHAFWASMTGFWTPDTTFAWIRVSPIDLSPKDD